jgi:hypothetical protein
LSHAGGLVVGVDLHQPRGALAGAQPVDAAMADGAQQPVEHMRGTGDLRQRGMQLHEGILRQLFCILAAAGEPQRHAEHARLVGANQPGEGEVVAALRGRQVVGHRGGPLQRQRRGRQSALVARGFEWGYDLQAHISPIRPNPREGVHEPWGSGGVSPGWSAAGAGR